MSDIENEIHISNKKHRTSFILAVLAIIVSIVSPISILYYQYWRYVDDVTATILIFSRDNSKKSTFVAEIVFINNGNQPGSVIGIAAKVPYENDKGKITAIPELSWVNEQPFTIYPKDVITKQILLGNHMDLDSHGHGESTDVSLLFRVVDSLGKYHEIEIPIGTFDKSKTINGVKIYKYKMLSFPATVNLLPSAEVDVGILSPQQSFTKKR